jgi:hypothetical protein
MRRIIALMRSYTCVHRICAPKIAKIKLTSSFYRREMFNDQLSSFKVVCKHRARNIAAMMTVRKKKLFTKRENVAEN